MRKYIPVSILFLVCLVTGRSAVSAESIESSDGAKIYYEAFGEGPVIVLLHGLGSDRSSWQNSGFVDQLSGYRLILVDARGHGDSDGPGIPEAYAMSRFVDDLESIVLKESDSPPTFWGYSMGAAVGFHVMLHKPTLFSRYVLGDGMVGIYGTPPDRRSSELGSANVLRIQASRAFEGYKKPPSTMADFLEFDRTSETANIRENLRMVSAPTFIYRSGDTQRFLAQAEERTEFHIPQRFSNLEVHLFSELSHGELMGRSNLVAPRVIEFLESTAN